MTFLFILVGIVLLILVVEAITLRKYVRAIAIRVHVNGTRGKSSVTRYITAGLRAGGKRALGKVTGIKPNIVFPDGHQELIKRRGSANVREQTTLIRLAHALSCDALVLECMSVAPPLQQLETTILQPHLTVLTNILDDHFEELGATDREHTEAYCSGLPSNAIIVTNDKQHIWEIEQIAAKLKSRVVLSEYEDLAEEFPALNDVTLENVRLALTACTLLGIEKQKAMEGILKEVQKNEPLLYEIPLGAHSVPFINGFAVNDVPSAKIFLEIWRKKLGGWNNLVFVVNTRSDRPLRSNEFARWCSTVQELHAVILTGTHVPFMKRTLIQYGINDGKVTAWSEPQIQSPQRELKTITKEGTAIFGFGNIAGDGFKLLDVLKEYQLQASLH